jgi:hypothetical protein
MTPTHRRTLSGKLIPADTPRNDWLIDPTFIKANDDDVQRPVNDRARRRTAARNGRRRLKRGRIIAARSTIAERLATPAPSRGFLRRFVRQVGTERAAAELLAKAERAAKARLDKAAA